MKFSNEHILGAPTYFRVAEVINELMPDYGEKVNADIAIEAYIDRQAKNTCKPYPHADGIRKAFKAAVNVKPNKTVRWDATLAALSILTIENVTRRRDSRSSADEQAVTTVKCALAIARYLPDLCDVVRDQLRPLTDFVGHFCCERAKDLTKSPRIDADLRANTLAVIADAQQRLNTSVQLIRERLKEVKR